jgi:putative Mg2+ transporter-C (MgtC) family protein
MTIMVLPHMVFANLMTDLEIVSRVVIAFLLGALIGWERERHGGISAGIRTYGAISLGACVFGVVSFSIAGADPSRVAAQVVSGIGFLGGGLIFRQQKEEGHYVSGLTTAATLWATAAVGLAVALGMYTISFLTALLIYALLFLPRLKWWKKISRKSI